MRRLWHGFPRTRRFVKDKRGGILVYVAVAIPVLLGVSGLAVDVSVWHAQKRSIQTLADVAAIGGASELARMVESSNREALADTGAREDALASGAKIGDQIAVNIPPSNGDYANATNAVEVIVTRQVPSMLSRLINPDDTQISARSVAFAADGEFCVYALNDTATNALHISGGSTLSIDCGIMVNSNAVGALHVTGGGCVNASVIKVVGGFSAGGCYNGAKPFKGTEAISNPLAGNFPIPAEASASCTSSGNIKVGKKNSPYDLPAGRHCGKITVQKNSTLRLAGGTHVLDGALTVHGTVIEQTGSTGVTLYMGPGTGSADALNFAADADVSLSAPTSGPYAHLLVYVDEAATGNVKHNLTAKTSSTLNGLIYMPGQDLEFSGSAGAEAVMLIADEIKLSGQANFSNLGGVPYFFDQADLNPRLSE